ncbi:MAG: hypothetical protein AB4426_22705 [Xenococcaceae cyanobacterium]
MSVAPRPVVAARTYRSRNPVAVPSSKRNPRQDRLPLKSVRSRRSSRKVEELPTRSPQLPILLRAFSLLQHSSSVFTFCVIAGTLTVYALTVYTPKLWTREYKKLKDLQTDERDMTVFNEASKNQLAQEAESPKSGLVPPNPTDLEPIFLPTASVPPPPEPKTPTTAEIKLPVVPGPLAY